MKKYVIFVVLMLFGLLILLIADGATAAEGVRAGLAMAYRNVLPALFPAAVICGIIGELVERIPLRPTATLWLNAQLCGFPLGIKTVVRARQRGLIDREQALRLSRCVCNASPAFLISYLGDILYGDLRLGALLYGGQAGLSLVLALRYRAFTDSLPLSPSPRPALIILTDSIGNAANGCLLMTAFITAFSAVAALCARLPYFSYWYGALELTGGIAALPRHAPLWVGGIWVGFSSLSVLLQNAALLVGAELSPWPMIQSKLIGAAVMPMVILCPQIALLFFIFAVFLISFVKCRKKSYNRINHRARTKEWRNL